MDHLNRLYEEFFYIDFKLEQIRAQDNRYRQIPSSCGFLEKVAIIEANERITIDNEEFKNLQARKRKVIESLIRARKSNSQDSESAVIKELGIITAESEGACPYDHDLAFVYKDKAGNYKCRCEEDLIGCRTCIYYRKTEPSVFETSVSA